MDRRTRLLVGTMALVAVAVAGAVVSPAWLFARLDWLTADPVRFAVACLLLALVRPLLAWPTTLLAVVVGYGFGLRGAPFALALVVVTSVPPYAVARRARGEGRVATAGARVVDAAGDLRSVTASRLVPAPSDVVSAAAGVAGVGPSAFVLGTAIGEVPWVGAGVVAGASLEALAAGSVSTVFDPKLVALAGVLAAVLLAEPTYRVVRNRQS